MLDDRSALAGPRPRQLSDRAREFRIILSARQEADAILADASEVRRNAGLQAELLVAEAEALSRDLTEQAMSVLDQAIGEAREQAEGILAVARESAEDVRRSARAQVVTDREAFQAEMDSVRRELGPTDGRAGDDVLADMENTIRTLAAALQRAQDSVTDAERTIDLLRTEISGTPLDTSARAPERDFARTAPTAAPHRNERPEESREPRPLGWLFRSDRSV